MGLVVELVGQLLKNCLDYENGYTEEDGYYKPRQYISHFNMRYSGLNYQFCSKRGSVAWRLSQLCDAVNRVLAGSVVRMLKSEGTLPFERHLGCFFQLFRWQTYNLMAITEARQSSIFSQVPLTFGALDRILDSREPSMFTPKTNQLPHNCILSYEHGGVNAYYSY